ncbi:MAG: hypothetical protein VX642_01535 [Bdellovibrionota bacterium]|nr:hypothetical protein [Bdellovibrionota bacterium]
MENFSVVRSLLVAFFFIHTACMVDPQAVQGIVKDKTEKVIQVETASDGSGVAITQLSLYDRSEDLELFLIEEAGDEKTNVEANWVLSGSIGDLIIFDGGKKARFTNYQVGFGYIKVTYGELVKQVEVSITANEVPSLSFTQPMGGDDLIAVNSIFDITWTDADTEENGNISLYYANSSGGSCEDGTLITDSLKEDSDGASGTFTWDLTGLPTANYYICAVISDGLGSTESWSNALKVNTSPTIAITQPMESDDSVYSGELFNVQWTDSDPDHDAQVSLYYNSSNTGSCNSGTLIVNGVSEDANAGSGSYSFNTSGLATGSYYICALIDDGMDTAEVYSDPISVTAVCEWTGAVSTDWSVSENWTNCSASIPTDTDYVYLNDLTNKPVVTANTPILGVVGARENTTVTINSGVSLSVYGSSDAFRADVTFKGATADCSDCRLLIRNLAAEVNNSATLTILSGTEVYFNTIYAELLIGNGTSAGHLVVSGGATESEWPVFIGNSDRWSGLIMEGTGSEKSSVSIDGVHMAIYPGFSDGIAFKFQENYQIKNLDNVKYTGGKFLGGIYLYNCSTGSFTDTTWSNHNFRDVPYIAAVDKQRGINVRADSCSGISITMDNASGWAWGSVFENDPNNVIAWTGSETSYTCTWNGSVSTDWFTPANWSNCSNGRNSYPDQFDKVILDDSVGNQPVLTSNAIVQEFPLSTNAGQLTVDSSYLFVVNGELKQDLKFIAATADCSDCKVLSESFTVNNSKTLTLEDSILLGVHNGNKVNIGDGTSSGHFVTQSSDVTDPTKWPTLGTFYYYFDGLIFNGLSSSDRSTSTINGLNVVNYHQEDGMIVYKDNFNIAQMDNVKLSMSYTSWLVSDAYISIDTCANSVISDLTWDGFDFVNDVSTGYNLSVSNCSGVGPVTINPLSGGTNLGFGSSKENDTDSVIDWGS